MYFYRRNFSCIFRNVAPKRTNSFKNNKFIFGNKSCYSNILDNRLKSSLESSRFTKNISNNIIFPRYDQVNRVLSKYNISLVTQSLGISTNSSNTIELNSDDELPEMTDEAISVEPTISSKSKLEFSSNQNMDSKSNLHNLENYQENSSKTLESLQESQKLEESNLQNSKESNLQQTNSKENELFKNMNEKDVKGTFKGQPLIGKEHGSVYTKHEPTMFGDWSHMGRVTDF